jgi:peptidoglycan-associated lipoprotein
MRIHLVGFLVILLAYTGITLAQSNASSPVDSQPTGVQSPPATPQDNARLVAAPELPPDKQREFTQSVKDVHFDFDKSDLRPEDRAILASDAEWLKAHPDVMVTLEGDADERGSIVYNLMLSGARATAVKDALVEMGVSPDRIAFATGWGELYPVCTGSDESCWSQNRRTHFSTWPPAEEETRVAIAAEP